MSEHLATFKAKQYRKHYYYRNIGLGYGCVDSQRGEEVANHLIWEGNLNMPYLKDNEKIYIKDLDEEYTVLSVVKSTDGSAVYQLDKQYDLIEDEQTENSKELAEKWEIKNEKLDEETDELLRGHPRSDFSSTGKPKKSWLGKIIGS